MPFRRIINSAAAREWLQLLSPRLLVLMADEFDRKPGSRDGKPNKSTRRNGALSGHKLDTITVQGYREQPADPATGMVPGVTYSVNKGKRWELVEQLKQQSLEDKAEQAANGLEKEDGESVVVIESHLGSKTRREAESEAGIHGWSRRHNGEFQRSEKEPEVIQTRRGPEVKQNVRKAQFNKGVSDNAYDPDRVYLVTHEPGPKGWSFRRNGI